MNIVDFSRYSFNALPADAQLLVRLAVIEDDENACLILDEIFKRDDMQKWLAIKLAYRLLHIKQKRA